MAYVLAGERELGLLLWIPWEIAARLVPVLADIALIPLVGRLATENGALRSPQHACAPLGLMISGIHGQFVPITLLFGVARCSPPAADRSRSPGCSSACR